MTITSTPSLAVASLKGQALRPGWHCLLQGALPMQPIPHTMLCTLVQPSPALAGCLRIQSLRRNLLSVWTPILPCASRLFDHNVINSHQLEHLKQSSEGNLKFLGDRVLPIMDTQNLFFPQCAFRGCFFLFNIKWGGS